MSTLRSSVLLNHNASDIWKVIRDTDNVADWFPAMESSSGENGTRTVILRGGASIVEDIVTLDDDLRRMQYKAIGGDLPIESHLGTVDVLAIDDERSIVVYGTEIEPASLASAFDAAISEAVAYLPSVLG